MNTSGLPSRWDVIVRKVSTDPIPMSLLSKRVKDQSDNHIHKCAIANATSAQGEGVCHGGVRPGLKELVLGGAHGIILKASQVIEGALS